MIPTNKKSKGMAGVVLVADDTAVMRHACQRALERAGHKVVLASDGNEAIALAVSNDIDVALLDIRMPGPSGIEVLKTIKEKKPLVEVIMMTAFATQDVAEDALQYGASGFLTKPFSNIKTLIDTVAQAVTRKRLKEAGLGGPIRIGDLLLNEGLIDKTVLAEAEAKAEEWRTTIADALVRIGAVQAEDIDWVIAKALDIPFVRLTEKDVDPQVIAAVPARLARKYKIFPILVEGGNIHIAVDDPFNKEWIDAVKRRSGLNPLIVKGFGPEIDAMINKFYESADVNISAKIKLLSETKDAELLMELLETAKKVDIEEVVFEKSKGAVGVQSWIFALKGIIYSKNGEGE